VAYAHHEIAVDCNRNAHVGIVGGLIVASAVPGIVPARAPTVPTDPLGSVLTGADEPKTSPCAWSCNPFDGVDAHEQSHLALISACGDVKGKVQDITMEVPGEQRVYHFTLLPDCEFATMANAANQAQLNGALMVEIEPQDQAIVPRLHIGEHLDNQGPLVTDKDHGWNEIHPAKIIQVLRSAKHRFCAG
jgi:hypothetical protein